MTVDTDGVGELVARGITRAAQAADPTGRPGPLPPTRADAALALAALGGRIRAARQVEAEALQDAAVWVPAARLAGVSVSEIARLTGLSRPHVYKHLGEV